MAKDIGFSGHAINSPALCKSRYVGTFLVKRDFDLLPRLFFDVVFEILNDVFNSRLDHARAGTEFQVFYRTLFVKLRGCDSQFLAKDLPQLMRDQHVVYPYGAHLSASAAHRAPIGQFGKSSDGFPVEINVMPSEARKEPSSCREIFFGDFP